MIPFLCMGMISTVCQSFSALREHKATWHTWFSQISPQFKALSISCRISSHPAAFSVLTARKTSATVMVFSYLNAPPVCPMVTEFKRSLKYTYTPHLPRMSFSLLTMTPFWSLTCLAIFTFLPQMSQTACQ